MVIVTNSSTPTSSSSSTCDSRRAVGNARGVKLILILPTERGAGTLSSFNFSENIFSEFLPSKTILVSYLFSFST